MKDTDIDAFRKQMENTLKGNAEIITFNCSKELEEEWQTIGDALIDSLYFK